MEATAIALAVSIVAILLVIPALFLGVYCLVCIKARDMAAELADQERNYSRDPLAARALSEPEVELGPSMYDLDRSDDDGSDFLEESEI